MGRLAEVLEPDATGEVAELYGEIRATLGLPFVALVYRHLAALGLLPQAWRALAPNLADGAVDRLADALAEEALVPLAALPARAAAPGVAGTLDGYNRANPRNLVAVLALLDGAEGSGALSPAGERGPVGEMLPMARLEAVPAAAAALLERAAAALTPPGDEVIVPSLLRHFAHDPGLLGAVWDALEPAVTAGVVAARAEAVAACAREGLAALPHPVPALPEARSSLERFVPTISRLLVAGVSLRAALR